MDKSTLYGFSLPKGTWMVMLSISNDDLWQKVKSGELKGLSIEGYFTNKFEQMQKKEPTTEQILSALNEMIQSKTELKAEKVELASVKELSKMINEFKSSFDKAVSAFDKIDNVVKAVAKPINKAQSLSVDIDREYKQFQKQAKELGVDIPNIIKNGVKDVKKLDSSLESMGNKVKSVEKA